MTTWVTPVTVGTHVTLAAPAVPTVLAILAVSHTRAEHVALLVTRSPGVRAAPGAPAARVGPSALVTGATAVRGAGVLGADARVAAPVRVRAPLLGHASVALRDPGRARVPPGWPAGRLRRLIRGRRVRVARDTVVRGLRHARPGAEVRRVGGMLGHRHGVPAPGAASLGLVLTAPGTVVTVILGPAGRSDLVWFGGAGLSGRPRGVPLSRHRAISRLYVA
ncbi:hypothetical protein [Nocardiopsis sp. CNR-923]|uniref:hypothetical protein n=1 Tax=Nocardiopsis sp. CNR-923 TaxID=1904965 RepID=UPI0013018306|nr:hypothetical protein [Nocardiopsis sp. CNR-923]